VFADLLTRLVERLEDTIEDLAGLLSHRIEARLALRDRRHVGLEFGRHLLGDDEVRVLLRGLHDCHR